MTKLYVGDTGTVIVLDCGQDISAATVRKINVRKPDGTEVIWDATAEGTDSIKYTTLSDTLNQFGVWKFQAQVTTAAGVWLGKTVQIRVHPEFR